MVSARSEQINGEKTRINCPACGAEDTLAQTFIQVERLYVLYVIPVLSMSNNFVRCLSCEAKLSTKLPLEELPHFSSEALEEHLNYEVSFVFRFLAMISLPLSVFPLVGLVVALLALIGTWNRPGWPRTVSRISTVLASIVSLLLLAVFAFDL